MCIALWWMRADVSCPASHFISELAEELEVVCLYYIIFTMQKPIEPPILPARLFFGLPVHH